MENVKIWGKKSVDNVKLMGIYSLDYVKIVIFAVVIKDFRYG